MERDIGKIIVENKAIIAEFPFLKPTYAWSGEEIEDYDYTWTELDEAPKGWKDLQLRFFREVTPILKKADYFDKYRIVQNKEKWGYWHLYINGIPTEISEEYYEILSKYEEESEHTCISCGKEGKMTYCGWISPFCKECWENNTHSNVPYEKAIENNQGD